MILNEMAVIGVETVQKSPDSNVRFCLEIGGAGRAPNCSSTDSESRFDPQRPMVKGNLTPSNLNTLRDLQSILHLDTKVSHGTGHICVPK